MAIEELKKYNKKNDNMIKKVVIILIFILVTKLTISMEDDSSKNNELLAYPNSNNLSICVQKSKWIKLTTIDDENFIIIDPCDGDIPTIIIENDTLIDNKGIDEPIKYKITKSSESNNNINFDLLDDWGEGKLDETVEIKPFKYFPNVYEWIRIVKQCWSKPCNEVFFIDTTYYTLYEHVNDFKFVRIECDSMKTIER